MDSASVNLDSIFRATAAKQPDLPAILGPAADACTTYADLDLAIAAAAESLARAGIGPADSVGIHHPSGAEYIVLTYAAWRIGACVTPLPVELQDDEQQRILKTIKITAVITTDPAAAFLTPFRRQESVELRPGAWVTRTHGRSEHPAGFEAINAAFIRFTSGTTARAKGVVLSHETVAERFAAANQALAIGPGDRVLWLLSMSYHFAVSIAGYLSLGAAIVLPRHHLGEELVAAAARHRATVLYGAPTHLEWMAADRSGAQLPHLRLAISTTTRLSRAVGMAFKQRFGLPASQALGLIEIGLPFINVDFAADRCDAIGRPLPAYRIKLADIGLGDQHREVLINGPGCLDAYYDPWAPRADILRDGWFHTGDVGDLDAEGCLILRGRVKDVFNVAGMKFFPNEVEDVLASHPDVAAACVLCEADGRTGESPYALVVRRPGGARSTDESTLVDYCQSRLASYKVPSRIEFVATLPTAPSGKILHRHPEVDR